MLKRRSRPPKRANFVEEGVHLIQVRHVGDDGGRLVAELFRQRFDPLSTPGGKDDVHPLRGEQPCRRFANPARGAANDGDLARQVFHFHGQRPAPLSITHI